MSTRTRPAPYTDNCPQCAVAVPCRPLGQLRTENSIVARYRCPRCAHLWRTSWQPEHEESAS